MNSRSYGGMQQIPGRAGSSLHTRSQTDRKSDALIALFFKAYAVKADIRLFIGVLSASSRPKGFALFEMNSQGLDPRTSLVEWPTRGGYPPVSQSDVHFLVMGPLTFLFNYLLSLVWNHHHYTFILGMAAGLATPPSLSAACLLKTVTRLEDPRFWKAHESERYVECATDTTLRRDHQAALSLYKDRGGIAKLFLKEAGRIERAVDDNEKKRAPRLGRINERKVPWSEEYPESHGIHVPGRIELTSGTRLSLVRKAKDAPRKVPTKRFAHAGGSIPLSDRSASSRKSEEVITDEPHAGKLARVVLAGQEGQFYIFLPNPSIIKYGRYHFDVFRFFRTREPLGLCLDLLRAKSEGLVPIGIALGLIPRLMTKGESAWRKVKIEGSREKFPSGVFRRSEGIQCPTTDSSRNCIIGVEPGMAGSERLGHRNLDHLRAGKRKPPRPDQSKQQCRIRPPLAWKEFTRGHQLPKIRGDPMLTAHGNIRPILEVVRVSF
ncbi:hypothetical protein ACFE04_011467 [Oxalis oulophora]